MRSAIYTLLIGAAMTPFPVWYAMRQQSTAEGMFALLCEFVFLWIVVEVILKIRGIENEDSND